MKGEDNEKGKKNMEMEEGEEEIAGSIKAKKIFEENGIYKEL